MSYDRVEYSDRAHFSSPSDEHHYSDDPVRNGSRSSHGNGIYNDYTVELKPKQYKPTFNFLCCQCKNTKRVKFVMAGACVVFILAMVLVVISAIAHYKEKSSKPKPAVEIYGLVAFGPDETGFISFSAADHKSYMNYFNRLEAGLSDYNTLRQVSDVDKYTTCNETYAPEGKVCMQTLVEFGENCQNFEMYGITEERPCVLLVLKPEKNVSPVSYDFTKPENVEILAKLGQRISNATIAVSCEGKTKNDQTLLSTMNYNEGQRIDYNPPKGFPMYYFQHRDLDGHLYPAVMVQFNTVPTRHQVNVKCTAWAKNVINGVAQNSSLYSTEFSIYLT